MRVATFRIDRPRVLDRPHAGVHLGGRLRLPSQLHSTTDTSSPGVASTSGQDAARDMIEEPCPSPLPRRQLGVGNTTVVPKLAGAIAGELLRCGQVTLQATSSQNHLKAVSALAIAQSMSQDNTLAFTAALAFESLEASSSSAGKPRRLKTLHLDLRQAATFQVLPPQEGLVLKAEQFQGEQPLQDALLQALLEQPDGAVVVAARGDTPVNRVTRVVARLQALFREQGIADSIQTLPCQLAVPAEQPDDGSAKPTLYVAFALQRTV